jgi:hypothetical protein
MSDTGSQVAEQYRRRLLGRSGEERLKMASSMRATPLARVRASVLSRDPQASPPALRRAVLLVFYGDEFTPEVRDSILARLALSSVE